VEGLDDGRRHVADHVAGGEAEPGEDRHADGKDDPSRQADGRRGAFLTLDSTQHRGDRGGEDEEEETPESKQRRGDLHVGVVIGVVGDDLSQRIVGFGALSPDDEGCDYQQHRGDAAQG
jgi:hypothetical protein